MNASVAVELQWQGPFFWPGTADAHGSSDFEEAGFAGRCGVYLWTVEHEAGFLIYAAGITRRPFRKRFREHTRAYRSGVYTVFDAASLMRGERRKVWPGFWFRPRTRKLEDEYRRREPEIIAAREELLSAYRVFLAPLVPGPRILERIEAAIMDTLYSAGGAAAEVPDRGMALSPRWQSEPAFTVKSTAAVLLHGLPNEFEA